MGIAVKILGGWVVVLFMVVVWGGGGGGGVVLFVFSFVGVFCGFMFKFFLLFSSPRLSSRQLLRACKPCAKLNPVEGHELPENLFNIVKSFQLVRF